MTTTTFFAAIPDAYKAVADRVFAGLMSGQPAASATDHLTQTHWAYMWLRVPAGASRDFLAAFHARTATAPADGIYTQAELDALMAAAATAWNDPANEEQIDPETGELTFLPFTASVEYVARELDALGVTIWQDPVAKILIAS